MSIYYVSTDGSDANPGTFALPFLTIAFALGELAPGDFLEIRAGTWDEAIDESMVASGSSGSPITIEGYANESVILQPAAVCKVLQLETTGKSYLIFKRLVFDQSEATCTTEPVVSIDSNQSNILIERCEVINGAAAGILCAGTDNRISRSTIHDNAGDGVVLGENTRLVNSLVYDNGDDGVFLGADVDGASVYHNTIVANTGHGVNIDPGAENFADNLKNNIFWDNGGDAIHSTGTLLVDTGGELLLTGGGGGIVVTFGSHNTVVDPLFTNEAGKNFHLTAASPAIDTGEDLSALSISEDYDGTPRPINSLYDIGAYEFFAESSEPPGEATGAIDFGVSLAGVGELIAEESTGNLDFGVDIAAVGESLSNEATGAFDLAVELNAFSQIVLTQLTQNPKIYLLRATRARIGANGIIEFDLVKEDISIYDAVAENPLLGAGVHGGSPSGGGSGGGDDSDNSKPGATRLALLDIPQLMGSHDTPGFYAAANGINDGWNGALLFEKVGQDWIETTQLVQRAPIGNATTLLLSGSVTLFDAIGRTYVFDDVNTIDVTLIEGVSALQSVSDSDLFAGRNACAIGVNGRWEVLAFGIVEQIEAKKWRLSHLLRGLKGTEFAVGIHQVGDQFVLLSETIRRVEDSYGDLNVARKFRGVSIGLSLDSASNVTFTDTGVSLKPLAPVYLRGEADASDNRTIRWWRRSRLDGLAGRDGTASPPLDESFESYEVDIYNAAGTTVIRTIATTVEYAVYTASQQTADFGSVPASIKCCVYQMSAQIGRGYGGCATISAWTLVGEIPPEPSESPYDVAGSLVGKPDPSMYWMGYPFPRTVSFSAGLPQSRGIARVAATASSVFSLKKASLSDLTTFTQWGTMTFGAGSRVATFAAAADTEFTGGDHVLAVVAPAVPDLTLEDIWFSLAGIRT